MAHWTKRTPLASGTKVTIAAGTGYHDANTSAIRFCRLPPDSDLHGIVHRDYGDSYDIVVKIGEGKFGHFRWDLVLADETR